MSQINREYRMYTFTKALEDASNADFAVLSWEGKNSILTNNPYIIKDGGGV